MTSDITEVDISFITSNENEPTFKAIFLVLFQFVSGKY
nr:MAG TPA: hypothetical protein [Caudoviricetes sp.]DAT63678.1 MAG TPA: hypothetical protein [Caudoviricetes sp.]